MNPTCIIDKMDSHRLADYRSLSKVIAFEQCVAFLDKVGKVIYGQPFRIHPIDYKVIFQLLVYFYYDLENVERLGLNLKKGILLSGPVGCGKTSLMYLFRNFLAEDEQYRVVTTQDIRLEFLRDGFPVVEKYTSKSFIARRDVFRPKTYCFDELGLEGDLSYYGNETNVMADILLGRYPLFIHQGGKTGQREHPRPGEIDQGCRF